MVKLIFPFQEIQCFCGIEIQNPAADEKHSFDYLSWGRVS